MSMDLVHPTPNFAAASKASARYAMTNAQFAAFVDEMFTTTFIQSVSKLFSDPIDGVISAYCYPFDVSALNWSSDTTTNVKINGYTMQSTGLFVRGVPSAQASGLYTFTPHFNSFMDYSPYTKIEIYLPFIGWETLPPEEVIGQTISIQYVFDFYTGKCQCYILSGTGADVHVVLIRSGQVGVQIQMSGGASSAVARNLLIGGISAAGSIAAGVLSGGIAGAAMIGSGISNALGSAQMVIKGGGHTDAMCAFYGPLDIIVKISRQRYRRPSGYGLYIGRPSMQTKTLSQLSGYTVVHETHVEGSGFAQATHDEIAEIETLLKSGIIL